MLTLKEELFEAKSYIERQNKTIDELSRYKGKFNLDETVIFDGARVIIEDYSPRHNEYDIRFFNDKVLLGISEGELSKQID